MTLPAVVVFDPLRDKTYQSTRLGRDIADFLAWGELGGMSPRTLDQYERDLAKGALMFPDRGLPRDGDDYEQLTDGDAIHIASAFHPRERRTRVAAWKSFYKWALKTRRATINPFDVLPTIKRQPQKVHDIFTDAEIEALCGLPLVDGALMAIMFDTGARKGDCRNLQLRHFRPDPAPGALTYLGGKGGKDRLVPVTLRVSQAISELALLEGLGPKDHLFYCVRANALSRMVDRRKRIGDGSFDRWWKRCLDDAGVRYRNPHTTRHTFATRWLRRGGRLETLSIVLGHESIRTTFDQYGHLDTTDVLADLAVIEAHGA